MTSRRLSLLTVIGHNLRRKPYRTAAIVSSVLLVTGTLFGATLAMRGVQHALRVGLERMGADIVVVPAGQEVSAREAFIVAIQAGAILAVCWEYRKRLTHFLLNLRRDAREQKLAVNVAVGFLPAALIGVLAKSSIERFLFKPLPVAMALVVGGLVILWAEARHRRRYGELDQGMIDDR